MADIKVPGKKNITEHYGLNVRLEKRDHDKYVEKAKAQNVTLAAVVRALLEAWNEGSINMEVV